MEAAKPSETLSRNTTLWHKPEDLDLSNTRVYPKVSGLAAWSQNFKWYSSLHYLKFYRYFLSQFSEF
jgi:hypothetical protein